MTLVAVPVALLIVLVPLLCSPPVSAPPLLSHLGHGLVLDQLLQPPQCLPPPPLLLVSQMASLLPLVCLP